jgi:adenylate cyclase
LPCWFLATPFLVERAGYDTLDLPATGWLIGWLLAYTAISSGLRAINAAQREFAQGALGKYLPRSVASEIMRNPERLSLHGEKREIFCLFSDLEGFTKLTHAVEPEMIARLLNDYLDRLSAVVLQYGGTLDKFVGDAVVAFWGAPIAYPDDGERAVKAAWAMYQAGEEFRKSVPEGVPRIGRTRVGVHYGEAVVGNFGGEGRIQYTALGDAMNTAARLEGANKPLDTRVLVSREAAERSGLDWFRPMGAVTLRGRKTPVDIFEPVPEMDDVQRRVAVEAVEAHAAGDTDRVKALTDTILESAHDDEAMINLIQRLRQTHKGESYVLG